MPTRSIRSNRVDNGLGYLYSPLSSFQSWNHSLKVNGRLVYRANSMSSSKETRRLTARVLKSDGTPKGTQFSAILGVSAPNSAIGDQTLLTGCTNRAFAKISRAIRGETSSLGVTLGSYKQGYAMIAQRARQITRIANMARRKARQRNAALARLRARLPPGAAVPQDLLPVGSANIFLEGIFGWGPLLQDIHDSAKAIASPVPSGEWFSGRATNSSSTQTAPTSFSSYTSLKWSQRSKCRVTMTAKATINNPNLWLLNKLGLINPALVIWDLIPWSFVVGMFANINAVLGSYTAFYGLTISEPSTTVKWDVSETWTVSNRQSGVYQPGDIEETGTVTSSRKARTLGLVLPTLQLRTPTLELGLALTSLSLMTQQVSKLEFFKR